MSTCSHCAGPLSGAGYAGRPWPGRSAAAYCCYGCLSLGEYDRQQADASSRVSGWKLDGLGIRLGIGILVVGQSMMFGLALNLHDDVPPAIRQLTQWFLLAATLLVAVLLGGPLVRAAVHELRRGRLTLEALFLLTLSGALAASLQAHLTGRGHVYFEVVSVLLVVYTLGKVIGARARAAALAGSRAWAGQLGTCRLVDEKGRTRTVPASEVLPGDVAEVDPGETFTVDGIIRRGTGFVSEAAVSGEPFAVVRRPGDRVLAGAASHDATFHVEATAPGTDRQIDRLLAAVEEARDRPLSLQRQADRIGRVFLPLVVAVAAGTFVYWAALPNAGWEAGLFNALSVLLVACPCALGLATPIVIWSAVGRLAERGLIVRAGDAVERLAEVDRVLFDKTGTLTDEHFTLVDVATVATGDERARLLGWVALVEAHANHPVAKPFAQLPHAFPPGEEPRVRSVRVIPGCGVEAEISEADGTRHTLQIGREAWITPLSREPQASGLHPVFAEGTRPQAAAHRIAVALDDEVVAVAIVAERLRDSTPAMLADFHALGLPVTVLTGDTLERAAGLGLPPAHANLLPDDKKRIIADLTATGEKPLMVGDGINDASALAAAHAGIALASGTDLAVGAAALTLYHGDLRVVPWAVAVSREAVRTVRRNLYRAVAFNLTGMTLAACGVLHPIAAVLLMTASSLWLVLSSTRVGTSPDACRDAAERERNRKPSRRTRGQAAVHALAFALQGVVALLLLESLRDSAFMALGGFALVGVVLAVVWYRWRTLPHTLDMGFGMLTLGNLGMLLGWWADAGFAPLQDSCGCMCGSGTPIGFIAPGMWVGMLLFANVAMLGFGRRPWPRGRGHGFAMFTGGNVGMVAGMATGGWAAGQVEATPLAAEAALHFAGMTAGMIAGMLAGTWLITAFNPLAAWGTLTRIVGGNSKSPARSQSR